MKFYVKLDKDNIIRDIVEYAYGDYVEVELETPLPAGVNGGWWKYENGQLVEIPELKPIDSNDLNQRITDLEMALAAIIGGGN